MLQTLVVAKATNLNREALYRALSKKGNPRLDTLTKVLKAMGLRTILMRQYGIQDIQTQVHTLVHRAGTQAGQDFYEDAARWYRVGLPFFEKWTHVPDDYQEIYEQALMEMQQPDFVSTTTLLTAWGTTHKDGKALLMGGRK